MGLVGSAIVTAFPKEFSKERIDFTYEDTRIRHEQFEVMRNRLSEMLKDDCLQRKLSIVWSAGKAGFSANEQETEKEMNVFRNVLAFANECAESNPQCQCSFHLISSAGGLFEGQTHVLSTSAPSPQRPYGVLKLAEEEQLLSSPECLRKSIYRLGTVYGYIRKGCRFGLITTLIYNGICQRVSHIYGYFTTLRDYVWNGDVGKYIAGAITAEAPESETTVVHLVSGKPSSIYEIKSAVEVMLDKKIYIAFGGKTENSRNIAFSKTVLPDNWQPVDLHTAIRLIYDDWKQRGGVL